MLAFTSGVKQLFNEVIYDIWCLLITAVCEQGDFHSQGIFFCIEQELAKSLHGRDMRKSCAVIMTVMQQARNSEIFWYQKLAGNEFVEQPTHSLRIKRRKPI